MRSQSLSTYSWCSLCWLLAGSLSSRRKNEHRKQIAARSFRGAAPVKEIGPQRWTSRQRLVSCDEIQSSSREFAAPRISQSRLMSYRLLNARHPLPRWGLPCSYLRYVRGVTPYVAAASDSEMLRADLVASNRRPHSRQ